MLQIMVPFLQIWQTAICLLRLYYLIVLLSLTTANLAYADADQVKNAISDIKLISTLLPIPKPDLILFLGGDTVSMEGPHARPSIEEVLPISTSTVAELLALEADVNVKREISLTLNKNETLADLLKRADFTSSELYQVADVVSQKINVRKLGIGMNFTIGFDENNTPIAVKNQPV